MNTTFKKKKGVTYMTSDKCKDVFQKWCRWFIAQIKVSGGGCIIFVICNCIFFNVSHIASYILYISLMLCRRVHNLQVQKLLNTTKKCVAKVASLQKLCNKLRQLHNAKKVISYGLLWDIYSYENIKVKLPSIISILKPWH